MAVLVAMGLEVKAAAVAVQVVQVAQSLLTTIPP
jgi:hypothetical protein